MSAKAGYSVVIPLYNKRGFVRRAVMSVLAQDLTDFELLVIDDGSTDGGAGELRDIADPRLRLVTQANAGVAAARNRGIAEATREWVAFLDADDWWRPEHLTELALTAARWPRAGIIASRVQQVRGGKPIPSHRHEPLHSRIIDYFAEAAKDILVVHTSATAVRRDLARTIGGFRNLRPGQDIDLWCRMALAAPVAVSDRQTSFYARDTGGAMANWAAAKSRSGIERLEQFGGAVETLAHALASGAYEDRRVGIERYIDARILSGARKCIASGDMANARRRLSFVYAKTSREYWTYRLIALLPGRVMISFVTALKRRRHPPQS